MSGNYTKKAPYSDLVQEVALTHLSGQNHPKRSHHDCTVKVPDVKHTFTKGSHVASEVVGKLGLQQGATADSGVVDYSLAINSTIDARLFLVEGLTVVLRI